MLARYFRLPFTKEKARTTHCVAFLLAFSFFSCLFCFSDGRKRGA